MGGGQLSPFANSRFQLGKREFTHTLLTAVSSLRLPFSFFSLMLQDDGLALLPVVQGVPDVDPVP
jgi:hypothetical protein